MTSRLFAVAALLASVPPAWASSQDTVPPPLPAAAVPAPDRAAWFAKYQDARSGPESIETVTRTFTVGPTGALDIFNLAGPIVVTGTDGDQIVVTAVKRVRGPAEHAKAQLDAQTDAQKAQIDAETRIRIATIQAETAIATAQIAAGTSDMQARLKHVEEILGHKADFLMQERELAHDDQMADKQHEQAVDEGERGHQYALEEGEQGAEAAERQIVTKAEVAPKPQASA